MGKQTNDPLVFYFNGEGHTSLLAGFLSKDYLGVHGSDRNYGGFQSIYIHYKQDIPLYLYQSPGAAFDKFRSAFAALNYCSMAGFSIVCSDGTTAASAWEVPRISGMVEERV